MAARAERFGSAERRTRVGWMTAEHGPVTQRVLFATDTSEDGASSGFYRLWREIGSEEIALHFRFGSSDYRAAFLPIPEDEPVVSQAFFGPGIATVQLSEAVSTR